MRGVILVAYGNPAIRCLHSCVASLESIEPEVEWIAISDVTVPGWEHKMVRANTADQGARSVKTRLPAFVPDHWEQVLYLDVDTIVLRSLARFWVALDAGWDVVLCRDETTPIVRDCRLKHEQERAYTVNVLGTGYVSQFAGGAMAWNVNSQTSKFFRLWHEEWRRFQYRDQGALTRALSRLALRLWVLEYRANATDMEEAVEIWHKHGEARRRGAQ